MYATQYQRQRCSLRGATSNLEESDANGPPEVTSLADELRMMEVDSLDNERSLLPAQDSCEVDSIPEERGNQGGPAGS